MIMRGPACPGWVHVSTGSGGVCCVHVWLGAFEQAPEGCPIAQLPEWTPQGRLLAFLRDRPQPRLEVSCVPWACMHVLAKYMV